MPKKHYKPEEIVTKLRQVQARQWKTLATRGFDPSRHKKESGRTVSNLCAEYLEVHAIRKRSGRDDKAKIEQYILPRLGRKLVKDVTFSDVERLHRSLKKTPYAANRAVALLSKMFSLAIQWEWAERNPARGIERFPEERRERFLSPDEINRLSLALIDHVVTAKRPNEARKVADAIRLLMLTGARRSEVLSVIIKDNHVLADLLNFLRRQVRIFGLDDLWNEHLGHDFRGDFFRVHSSSQNAFVLHVRLPRFSAPGFHRLAVRHRFAAALRVHRRSPHGPAERTSMAARAALSD